MPSPHVLIVDAGFYRDIADELVLGATEALTGAGATFERISVPGALEIPPAISFAALSDDPVFDAFVALGCVIRGETTHYDYVCGESARALMDLGVHEQLAIGNGVLTVENRDQAWARASRSEKNKGRDAAEAALALAKIAERFGAACVVPSKEGRAAQEVLPASPPLKHFIRCPCLISPHPVKS